MMLSILIFIYCYCFNAYYRKRIFLNVTSLTTPVKRYHGPIIGLSVFLRSCLGNRNTSAIFRKNNVIFENTAMTELLR